MPKRGVFSPDCDKNSEIKRLKRQLREMQERLDSFQSSESPSQTDDSSHESDNTNVNENKPTKEAPPHPLEPEITIVEENTDSTKNDFNFLGCKLNQDNEVGKPMHDEIAVRWNNSLKKGISKKQREELTGKYKIPENCKEWRPSQINSEIQPCLPKAAREYDRFMTALQQQLTGALAALGNVIETMILVQEQSDNLKILADAGQLPTNVHYAISAHRRFKITPHLNSDCRKVADTLDINEFLFSKMFAEAGKNEKAVENTSYEFKKKSWTPSFSGAGTSSERQNTTDRYLNYQRPRPKVKDRRKEERRPSNYQRGKYQKKKTRRYYRQK